MYPHVSLRTPLGSLCVLDVYCTHTHTRILQHVILYTCVHVVCAPACNLFNQQDADSSVSSLHHSTLDEVSSQSLTQVLYVSLLWYIPVASYNVLSL